MAMAGTVSVLRLLVAATLLFLPTNCSEYCVCTGPCPKYGKWTCHYANGTVDQQYKYGNKAECAKACHSETSDQQQAAALVWKNEVTKNGTDHCVCTGPCPKYGKWTCHYANGTVDEHYKYGNKAECVEACHSDTSDQRAPALARSNEVTKNGTDHCVCTGPCPKFGKWTCHYANGTVDQHYKYGDKAGCVEACHSETSDLRALAPAPSKQVGKNGTDHCVCTGPCPQYGKWTCHYANGTVDQHYKYGDKAACVEACHSETSGQRAPALARNNEVAKTMWDTLLI